MKTKHVNLFIYGLVVLCVILVMAKLNGCSPAPSGDGNGGLSITDRFPALDSTKTSTNIVLSILFNMDMVTPDAGAKVDITPSFEVSDPEYNIFSKGANHTAGTCESDSFYRWETKRLLRVYVEGPLTTTETTKVLHLVADADKIISTSGKKLAAGTTLWRFEYDNSAANYSISGTCSDETGSSGKYMVGIFDFNPTTPYDSLLTGTPEVDSPYTYTVPGLTGGVGGKTYYAAAFRDVNNNQRYDSGEPWGEYGGGSGSPVVITTSNETEIDITVEAHSE